MGWLFWLSWLHRVLHTCTTLWDRCKRLVEQQVSGHMFPAAAFSWTACRRASRGNPLQLETGRMDQQAAPHPHPTPALLPAGPTALRHSTVYTRQVPMLSLG